MPATKAQIRRARVIGHNVDFGDGVEVTFWYDRNKITDVWMEEWKNHEEQQAAPALNEMLADLIDRWDVLEVEGGEVIPVTAETIGELFSLPDKFHLMQELMTASAPTSAEGNASKNTSSGPTPSSSSELASPQNGPTPLLSPPPSASLPTT